MINKVILVGRITADPELKKTNNDISFVNFTIACNRKYSNQNGEKETDFIFCTVWRKPAELLAQYIKKGALIGVEGSLQVDQFEQNGEKRFSTKVAVDNIQFLDSKQANNESNTVQDNKKLVETAKSAVSSDDLPF